MVQDWGSITIIDFGGREVMSGKYSNTIDLNNLRKGIYFLRLIGKEITVVEKFAKVMDL